MSSSEQKAKKAAPAVVAAPAAKAAPAKADKKKAAAKAPSPRYDTSRASVCVCVRVYRVVVRCADWVVGVQLVELV